MRDTFAELAAKLAATAKSFHARGWLLGTSGNLSAVVQRKPLQLVMSPSGFDKGELTADQLLLIDDQARIVSQHTGKPSDESLLHLKIVQERGAGAVMHTHSVWNTLLSDLYGSAGGAEIKGYEMLKGLQGVRTHEHSEWLPIVENSQDMPALAEQVGVTLKQHPEAHAFLLRRHGLYTWGDDVTQAKRHVEILEFLIEVMGRKSQF